MGNTAILKNNYYPDYGTSEFSDPYNDLAIKELKLPIKSRLDSLEKKDTTYSNNEILHDSKKNIFSFQQKTNLNYICHSVNWTCYIIYIESDSFTAKLFDDKNDGTYEIAEFEISEISKSDLEYLREGAVFYWSVGYANHFGQVIKQSIIRFKRSIAIPINEFDTIIDEAKVLEEGIVWD